MRFARRGGERAVCLLEGRGPVRMRDECNLRRFNARRIASFDQALSLPRRGTMRLCMFDVWFDAPLDEDTMNELDLMA